MSYPFFTPITGLSKPEQDAHNLRKQLSHHYENIAFYRNILCEIGSYKKALEKISEGELADIKTEDKTDYSTIITKQISALETQLNLLEKGKNKQDLDILSKIFYQLKTSEVNLNLLEQIEKTITDLSGKNKEKSFNTIAQNVQSLGALLYATQEIQASQKEIHRLKTEMQKLVAASQKTQAALPQCAR